MQTKERLPDRRRRPARWAPWWAYVIPIVVTNQLRTWLLAPAGLATWAQIVIGVLSIAAVAALVTVVYRAISR
jgi:hypothetical protein